MSPTGNNSTGVVPRPDVDTIYSITTNDDVLPSPTQQFVRVIHVQRLGFDESPYHVVALDEQGRTLNFDHDVWEMLSPRQMIPGADLLIAVDD